MNQDVEKKAVDNQEDTKSSAVNYYEEASKNYSDVEIKDDNGNVTAVTRVYLLAR